VAEKIKAGKIGQLYPFVEDADAKRLRGTVGGVRSEDADGGDREGTERAAEEYVWMHYRGLRLNSFTLLAFQGGMFLYEQRVYRSYVFAIYCHYIQSISKCSNGLIILRYFETEW
jgi:hypothetical protein